MYGLIYNTLRSLVVDNYGEEAWSNICSKAGVDTTVYLDHQYYDEAILFAVGAATSELLGTPLEDILEKFGIHFFETIKKSGHSSLLRTLGHNLYGFLVNLDSLHDHLSFTYTQMQAPSFRCEKTPSGLRLHYYSYRKGLEAIVIGIVKAVAKSYFDLEVDVKIRKCEELDEKLSFHCVLDIERLSGPQNKLVGDYSDIKPIVPEEPDITDADNSHSDEESMEPPILPPLYSRRNSAIIGGHASDWPITVQIFQNCFPFHIIFDKDLIVWHMGVSLSRVFPHAIGALVSDYFELARPPVDMTYGNIRSYAHNVFILNIKMADPRNSKGKKTLHFRGQMVPLSVHDPNSPILFLSSPRISSLEELELQGLYISDIPIHDVTRDLILLNRHFRVEMTIAEQLEKMKCDLEEEKARADRLLHAMLPPSIARELTLGAKASATEYSSVTILFSDIKGFTNICSECAPMCVVGMLNDLYTRFDSLIEKHNVYKVETIGDAYMVAAGLLDTSGNHAEAVANMAFDMRDAAKYVVKPATEEPLQIRIGIHSGPVVAGVVGLKMPRYCLFGDTVNTASRMESHGEADWVHISNDTYELLSKEQFVFYRRGKIPIKGLGLRETYFVEPFNANKKILPESAGQTLEPPSPHDYQTGVSRSTSFIKYKQITPLTSSTSEHNTSPLNALVENRSDHASSAEENAVIWVPSIEVQKRREEEEQLDDEGVIQAESSVSLCSSSWNTVNDSEDLPKELQPMGLTFALFLLCLPITLGLFLTFSKVS